MIFNKRLVLHVDDDPQFTAMLAALLRGHGYEVVSLNDPTRAHAELLSSDCRVVLLDIDMPQINGLDLLEQIKRQDGGVQVIMLTGLVSMNTVLECMRRGAEGCLFKPVDHPELVLGALAGAFDKLDRLWYSLQELRTRRKLEAQLSPTLA